jgi:hypothetical protein
MKRSQEGFFQRVLERAKPYMSDEHFTVDGTLVEAWASQKSFRRKDGKGKPPGPGGEVDFHGERRKNQTHGSTTDPDARLFRKSKGSEAKLGYLGHVAQGKAADHWHAAALEDDCLREARPLPVAIEKSPNAYAFRVSATEARVDAADSL